MDKILVEWTQIREIYQLSSYLHGKLTWVKYSSNKMFNITMWLVTSISVYMMTLSRTFPRIYISSVSVYPYQTTNDINILQIILQQMVDKWAYRDILPAECRCISWLWVIFKPSVYLGKPGIYPLLVAPSQMQISVTVT